MLCNSAHHNILYSIHNNENHKHTSHLPQNTLKQSNKRNRQSRANSAIHKVHQSSKNHYSNHKLQNKYPTGQSEESHV